MKHIVFLGSAYATEFAKSHPEARVTVLTSRTLQSTTLVAYRLTVAGFDEWMRAIYEINSISPIDRVVAFGEGEQLLAAAATESLSLRGIGHEVARRVVDKFVMREKLVTLAANGFEYHSIPDVETLRSCLAADPRRGSWVVKPVMGTGGEGVVQIGSQPDCLTAFDNAHRVVPPMGGRHGVLAERYIFGRQFCVESISELGNHYFAGLTEQFVDRRGLAAAGYCSPALIDRDIAARIISRVSESLTLLGVAFGPAHTEVIVDNDAVVHILETHTRLSGHGVAEAIAETTGFDFQSAVFDQIMGDRVGNQFNNSDAVSRLIRTPRAVSVWFTYAPTAGRLTLVKAPQGEEVQVTVKLKAGDYTPGDFGRSSRIVSVRAVASTPQQAVALARKTAEQAHIEMRVICTADLIHSNATTPQDDAAWSRRPIQTN